MLPRPESVPLEQLRRALQQRIAETSFRIAAREVGMSPSGLHTFLGGTSPHYSTVRKITAWYVREAYRGPDAASMEALQAALGLLTQHLPDSARPDAERSILNVVRASSLASRTPLPEWVELLALRSLGT